MTTRRNFARAKLTDQLRAERSADPQDVILQPPPGAFRRAKPPLKGCRDQWDGKPFPVAVTRLDQVVAPADQASKAQAA